MTTGSWVGRAVGRLAEDTAQCQAREEATASNRWGGSPLAQLPDRGRATVCGTLRTVTLRPRGGVPALEAELFDGSGTVTLVWLGRRRIAGIDPGRRLRVSGHLGRDAGRRVVYNPRYDLVPGGPGGPA